MVVINNNSLQIVTFQDLLSNPTPFHVTVADSLEFADDARKYALNDVIGQVSVGVGIWVVLEDGTIIFIRGFNVEEDTLQDCTCGEHCGLMAAYSQGYVKSCIGSTIVSEKKLEPRNRIILPCRGCRGRLQRAVQRAEISESEFMLVIANSQFRREKIIIVSLERLIQDPQLRYTREGVNPNTLRIKG